MMENEITKEGRAFYRRGGAPSGNPYRENSREWLCWDTGFWWEHNDAATAADSGGMEEAYPSYFDAYDDGRYDDDPNPYLGTYSEE